MLARGRAPRDALRDTRRGAGPPSSAGSARAGGQRPDCGAAHFVQTLQTKYDDSLHDPNRFVQTKYDGSLHDPNHFIQTNLRDPPRIHPLQAKRGRSFDATPQGRVATS